MEAPSGGAWTRKSYMKASMLSGLGSILTNKIADMAESEPDVTTSQSNHRRTRSATGCWTCRVRRKKCDETPGACNSCASLQLRCGGYGARPIWMDGGLREKQKAEELKMKIRRRRRLSEHLSASRNIPLRIEVPKDRSLPPAASQNNSAMHRSSIIEMQRNEDRTNLDGDAWPIPNVNCSMSNAEAEDALQVDNFATLLDLDSQYHGQVDNPSTDDSQYVE